MSSSDKEEEVRLAAVIKERARERMIESMREKDYEGFESARDHYEYADRYLDNYFTSEFNKEEEVRLAAVIKERARERMIESMREKDYEGFESARDHYEYADRYLDNYFTSEFNKVDNEENSDGD
ncbi:unnamed protein product [Hymenolepis diminuta]|uniref:Uncharacterized protein n=1 Tax=Hymenolepis diminuta TaxID=6216 RepID=A0A564YNT5_HYMDI|nr:unnamed protein product [Hymenolepis diminuta]